VLAALAPTLATAQDRPSEEDLFGTPTQPPAAEAPRGAPPPAEARPDAAGDRDEAGLLSAPRAVAREKDDPLDVGGVLYLRWNALAQEDVPASDWSTSSPNLLDVYLDVRPNDRVRAFALARTSYDPTVDEGGTTSAGLSGGSGKRTEVVLDQLFVNFDLARTAFVTAGKQHVKWGVGKFWNPTDFLHRQKRDPLATFDARTGVTMLRVHVPWEARGWNLYGVALLEDTSPEGAAVNTLGRVAGGGRAELVLGPAELGLDALVSRASRPRFGLDLSFGLWELDLYGEVALRAGSELPRWRLTGDPFTPLRRDDPGGVNARVVAGGSWTRNYTEEDVFTVGAEYFHDPTGYADEEIYPALLAVPLLPEVFPGEPAPFTPFYLGRHYAGVFASLPSPGPWNDTTFTLSALGNLSDRSGVVRLDHSVLVNTYLRVETFVSGSVGRKGGEFRFSFDPDSVPGLPPQARIDVPAPMVQAGVALRVVL
jgi:hypothetical protein